MVCAPKVGYVWRYISIFACSFCVIFLFFLSIEKGVDCVNISTGKNLFGDITEIYQGATCVARYKYDAWGNSTVCNPDGTENYAGNIYW